MHGCLPTGLSSVCVLELVCNIMTGIYTNKEQYELIWWGWVFKISARGCIMWWHKPGSPTWVTDPWVWFEEVEIMNFWLLIQIILFSSVQSFVGTMLFVSLAVESPYKYTSEHITSVSERITIQMFRSKWSYNSIVHKFKSSAAYCLRQSYQMILVSVAFSVFQYDFIRRTHCECQLGWQHCSQ